jgi:hypothetical protein
VLTGLGSWRPWRGICFQVDLYCWQNSVPWDQRSVIWDHRFLAGYEMGSLCSSQRPPAFLTLYSKPMTRSLSQTLNFSVFSSQLRKVSAFKGCGIPLNWRLHLAYNLTWSWGEISLWWQALDTCSDHFPQYYPNKICHFLLTFSFNWFS